MLAHGLRDSELAAQELAVVRTERDGTASEVRALKGLRDRILAAMPGSHARRVESGAEAVLEAYGFASRLAPRADHARRGLYSDRSGRGAEGPAPDLDHLCRGRDPSRRRLLEQHGLPLGMRRYLDAHAARAFGSYHAEAEFGEVIWRFAPQAAPVARAFTFHPQQQITEEPDGSLTVRFFTSGHLEMAWHLYQWGDAVDVLAPKALKTMVVSHRRSDFPALP